MKKITRFFCSLVRGFDSWCDRQAEKLCAEMSAPAPAWCVPSLDDRADYERVRREYR